MTQWSSPTTAELPPLGETFRRLRLQRGLSLDDAAAELGIPARSLRAIEWDRGDLLAGTGDIDSIERQYAAFLGLDDAAPTVETAETPSTPHTAQPTFWARYRQPLVLAAIGIAVAVGVFTLLSALT